MTTHITLEPTPRTPGGMVLSIEGDRPVIRIRDGSTSVELRIGMRELADIAAFYHQTMRYAMGDQPEPPVFSVNWEAPR